MGTEARWRPFRAEATRPQLDPLVWGLLGLDPTLAELYRPPRAGEWERAR
ncbi:MAG: hypothetical protein AB7N76_05540 [Planctomycetota bacterium]